MIYEVEISEQADSDLRGIFEYIAFELQSPENASGQLDRLEKQILGLDTMPERYRKYEKEPWKSRGLRVLLVDNYVVLYIPDSDKKVVTILRIMYAGRDIDNQLNLHTKQENIRFKQSFIYDRLLFSYSKLEERTELLWKNAAY